MCLAVPVKIFRVIGADRAVIDYDGVRKEIDISLIEPPAEGDYVLVHAGFAIEKLDPEDAERTLDMFREMMEGEEDG